MSYGTAFEDSCEHSWEIPSLKCPIYSSFVSGRLFMFRHFILFTVISKSISFDIESIYHSVHIPISLFSHFSHFSILLSSSEYFLLFFPFQLHCGAQKDTKSPLLSNVHTFSFFVPRVYKSWKLKLRLCLIILSYINLKVVAHWRISALFHLESKKAAMVGPHGCQILFLRFSQ